jgi:hypothetical protein
MINPHTSPQLENSYCKTVLVIESCKTKEQLEGASKMVENFKKLYGKVGYPKALSYNLDRKLDKQLWQL